MNIASSTRAPWAVLVLVPLLLPGCSSTAVQRQKLASDYPLDRARAAVALAEAGDKEAVHKLIDLLDDDDRAVRLYAILALERLCGTNMGYVYYAPQADRDAAVRRWREAIRNGEVVVRAPDAREWRRHTGPRLRGPDMSAPGELRLDLTSDVAELPAAREAIRTFVREQGWGDFDVADIVLAADEALTNVIRHGYNCENGHAISVEIRSITDARRGRGIEIVVRDRAPQVALEAIRGRDLDDIRPGGLGVHLIRSLMDDALYSHRDGGGMQLLMRRFEGRCPPPGGCCTGGQETP